MVMMALLKKNNLLRSDLFIRKKPLKLYVLSLTLYESES